jgi:GntR family transcriptional repressor for pyruvate dehydrogenase complex
MFSFTPIKQVRVYEEVLKQLKYSILAGRYRSGEKLPSERELSLQFQVSRVVVREAIRSLEMTGFVTLRQGPSGGAYVKDLTLEHLSSAFMDLFQANKLSAQELIQVRLHIEPEVARIAAVNIRDESSKSLEEAFQAEHNPTLSHSEWVIKNLEIHYILAEISGNRLYEAVVNPLLDLTREIVLIVKPSHKVIHDHREHKAIIDAVSSGDPDASAAAMVQHLSNVGSALVELESSYRRKKGLNLNN